MNKILKYSLYTASTAIVGLLLYFSSITAWQVVTASDDIRLKMAKDFDPYYAIDYDFENDRRNSSYDDSSDRLILKSGSLLVHEKEVVTMNSEYIDIIPEEILPRNIGNNKEKQTVLESYYFISDRNYKECQDQKKRRMKVFSDYFNKNFDYFQNEIVDLNENTSYLKPINFIGYNVPKLITVCTKGKMITLFGIMDSN